MKRIWKFIISILIPLIASFIGAFFTVGSVSTWYITLIKPSFNPPNWVFGPVWTILYLMMGVSLYLVWTRKYHKMAFVFWGLQLFLNILWSVLFFGLRMPLFAFVEIIFLWIAILMTIVYFYRINRLSAYLLIPYILWVSFAAILNFFLYILN